MHTELQRKRNGSGSRPLSKAQRSNSECPKFLEFSRGKITAERHLRNDDGGGKGIRTDNTIW